MSDCVDPVVGKILAGWRYDISGLAAEMRGDYEGHFAACERCRSRQRLHRGIDVGLIVLASFSAGVFLLAFGVIHHFEPRHALILELAALAGFALSALIWLAVAVATLWLLSVGEVADETIPVSTLLDVTGMCPERPRTRRATRLRLVSVFRQGWVTLLVALLRHEPMPQGRFVPEPWPVVPPLEEEVPVPVRAMPKAA